MHGVIYPGWKLLRDVIAAEANPRGLSWGMALGLLFGLLPKSNLTAAIVFCVLLLIRVNLAAGLFTGLLVSLFACQLDPFFGVIGDGLLALGPLQSVLRYLYSFPIVPWTHWNNTVVAGSLMVGLAVLWPTQRLLQRYFSAQIPRMRRSTGEKVVLHPLSH